MLLLLLLLMMMMMMLLLLLLLLQANYVRLLMQEAGANELFTGKLAHMMALPKATGVQVHAQVAVPGKREKLRAQTQVAAGRAGLGITGKGGWGSGGGSGRRAGSGEWGVGGGWGGFIVGSSHAAFVHPPFKHNALAFLLQSLRGSRPVRPTKLAPWSCRPSCFRSCAARSRRWSSGTTCW